MFKSKHIRLYLQAMISDGKNYSIILFLGLMMVSISACGVVQRGSVPVQEPSAEPPTPEKEIPYSTPSDDEAGDTERIFDDTSVSSESAELQGFLELAYKDWKGTPYLLGGSGYTGIDCSAFIQVVFEDYLLQQIPRTTREQMNSGKDIRKSSLRTGDLVFFKTGRRSYHVGVMVSQSEFLHASTSEGVKISKLEHPYWQETWLTGRRLID
ncbi:MAG TPA: hypothetical protein DD671_02410 [Balneolaceae bacterium]|nr:hypothetical protein [Balneolaceae bacterium]